MCVSQWCEKRKPFQHSMLASKTALFKLRKEIRWDVCVCVCVCVCARARACER